MFLLPRSDCIKTLYCFVHAYSFCPFASSIQAMITRNGCVQVRRVRKHHVWMGCPYTTPMVSDDLNQRTVANGADEEREHDKG